MTRKDMEREMFSAYRDKDAGIWRCKMKTGVILDVNDEKAVILLKGGDFVSVPAKADWEKGDIVSVTNNSMLAGFNPFQDRRLFSFPASS